jgi:hypothetical protein
VSHGFREENIAVVPEPATGVLAGIAGVIVWGVTARGRFRRRLTFGLDSHET